MRPRTLLALVVVGVLAVAGGWYFGTAEQPNRPARTTVAITDGGVGRFVEIDAMAAKPAKMIKAPHKKK